MKLLIYTIATKGYDYALTTQARRVLANLHADPRMADAEIKVVLVTSKSSLMVPASHIYGERLPNPNVEIIEDQRFGEGLANYQTNAQLLIAQMRTVAMMKAMAWGADYVWSLDSDVLPPTNALRCMLDMLQFDNGYYGVAFCPYPSQGGGLFLGGRGMPNDPILPNAYEDEKIVPKELVGKRKALQAELRKSIKAQDQPEIKRLAEAIHEVHKAIRDLPAHSNTFARNAKRWRKRGWLDEAYPAIGKGAVVPIEWTGSGCTLMNREAARLCEWAGYEGKGTEDLYVNFMKWSASHIRICAITHCPCDHVVRHRTDKGKLVHVVAYHEPMGECEGHLRQKNVPWYSMEPGETASKSNDGSMEDKPTALPAAETETLPQDTLVIDFKALGELKE